MRHGLDDLAALLAPGAWVLFAAPGPATEGYTMVGLLAVLLGLGLTMPKRRPDPGPDPAGASEPACEGEAPGPDQGSTPQTSTPL